MKKMELIKFMIMAGLVFAVGFWTTRAGAREVPFGPQNVISTTANGADSVYAADVDGDGDLDVLSTSMNDAKIAWYENDGASPPVFTARNLTATAWPQDVYAADVDGDGDLDLLSVSSALDTVYWYENNGASDPSFTRWSIYTAADDARSVYAADLDGDGDTDVLSASYGDDTIAWYENNGASDPSWTARTISTAADGPFSVYAADVDGDGDLDVLSASTIDDKIAWYENDGASPPGWTARTISTAANYAWSVYAADVDGDGDMDVLSASAMDWKIAWYENNGASPPGWTAHTISTAAQAARSVYAADMDGDGDRDVLSASYNDDKIAWYENLGGHPISWSGQKIISTAADGADSVCAADLDGDGDLDVLSASIDDDKIAWYENQTIHRSAVYPNQRVISTAADGAYSVFAADVDGDGDLDALSASSDDDKIAWYQNWGGNPITWTVSDISTSANYAFSVYAADVNGDGHMDVLSASSYDDKIAWYENDGASPPAWTARTISTAADFATSVFPADVDGDGDLDVLSASDLDNKIAWYESDGASPPGWTARTISTAADDARSVYAADLDRDGDTDVLSASFNDDKIAWYENNGSKPPGWTAHTISTAADGSYSVAAADLDGDGDLDVLSASYNDGKIAWYENDGGSPPAWTAHTISTAADGAQSVYATDLDRDGDLDVVSVSRNDDKVAWYESDGASLPGWTAHTISTAADSARSVYAADMDGDGDTDVLSASYGDNTIAWYENRGGQFALGGTTTVVANSVNVGVKNALLKILATHRGRVGDTDLELVTLELRFEETPGDPLTSAEANNLVENLYVYLDDGSGLFEADQDTLVTTVSSLSLTNGYQTVTFVDGDPYVQVTYGIPRTYFVAAEFTENAAGQTPNIFQVTHRTRSSTSSSTAEDRDYDIPLQLEFAEDVTTTVTTYNLSPSDISISTSTVSEGAAVGSPVGVLICTDPEGNYPCSYEILSSGVPFGFFQNVLVVGEALDYEAQSSYLLWIKAFDNKGAYYQKAFTITVVDVNEPPDAEDDSATVSEGGTATLLTGAVPSVLDNDLDPDGDVMAVNVTGTILPEQGFLVLNHDGTFSYTHDGSETVLDSFIYEVCDDGAPSLCDIATVTITVSPVNDAPVANDDTATVAEGGTVGILGTGQASLIANDTDADGILTLFTTPVTGPVNGAVMLYASGAFSYTHNGGEAVSDSFNYKACDGGTPVKCDYAQVTITVSPVNDTPVANADSMTVAEGGTATTPNLLANDTDAEGTLTLNTAPVSEPANGSLTLNANGTFSYTHNGSETASDSFTYRACDSGSLCANAVVSITVTPVNDSPVAVNDSATAAEGGMVSILSTGQASLLANDTDPDSALTLNTNPVANPANGTVTLYASGAFLYTHNGGETTSDSFTYRACDGGSLCANAVVSITVLPVNDAPSAVADFITVTEGGTVTAPNLLANDTDPDNSSLAVTVTPVFLPVNGTLALSTDGTFSYTHSDSDTLADSFTYQACDGGTPVLCATAVVSITVTPVDDVPVNNTPAAQLLDFDDSTPHGKLSGVEGTAITFTVGMANPVTGVTYEIQGLPEGASFDASTGVFTWTPTMSGYGEWLVTITATDGQSQISRDIFIMVDYLDADGDLLPDTWEVSVGMNPVSQDSDGDTISDVDEIGNTVSPLDTDGDGTIDTLDDDSDDDGVSDAEESGDADLSTLPWDTDGDDIPDYRDLDSDNDGVADVSDNCRLIPNAGQEDQDKDGIGFVCDTDEEFPGGGGGCGCTVGPNQPGDPLGLIGFLLVGIWIAVKKRRGPSK